MTVSLFNFAADVVDRYAEDPGRVALRWQKEGGVATDVTFLDLKIRSEKVAHVLAGHGVRPGHRLYILLPPCIAWWESVLGCMRAGAVAVLGEEASAAPVLKDQITESRSSLVIAPEALANLLDAFRSECPVVSHWLSVGWEREGWVDYDRRVSLAPAGFEAVGTRASDPCLLVYDQETSTGATTVTTHCHGDESYHLAPLDAWRDGMAFLVQDTSGLP